jgi:hypothetical protein
MPIRSAKTGLTEATIIINGEVLDFGQSMTVRVAIESLAMTIQADLDEIGEIGKLYLERIGEIRGALYKGFPR